MALQRSPERVQVRRLREVVVHAGGEASLAVAAEGVRGEGHDGDVRAVSLAAAVTATT
jgi:hypothetical protein